MTKNAHTLAGSDAVYLLPNWELAFCASAQSNKSTSEIILHFDYRSDNLI